MKELNSWMKFCLLWLGENQMDDVYRWLYVNVLWLIKCWNRVDEVGITECDGDWVVELVGIGILECSKPFISMWCELKRWFGNVVT